MSKEGIIVGYTTGIFDLFHFGHLNALKYSKSMCDRIIVGVTTDELALELKGKSPIIPYIERFKIIKSLDFVDMVVPEISDDKYKVWEVLKFDLILKGDDWKGTEKWNILEKKFKKVGVKVVFFPYTKNISSTLIRNKLEKQIREEHNTPDIQHISKKICEIWLSS
jgi:glycerol-3-phosphate cytidylyltransferase